MAEKRVSKKNLKRFAEKLKDNANILKRETSYNVNETVNKGQVVLKCITAGTTDKEALNLSAVSVGDTVTDGTVEWQVKSTTGYGSGDGGGTSVSEWATATSYEIGQIVIYGDSLYRCLVDHDSTTFSADEANWQLIFADLKDWATDTYYKVGVVVVKDKSIYRCKIAHTSDISDFNNDINNWDSLGSGKLEDWQPNRAYEANDIFVYDGQIYKSLVGFTSGATFAEINILEDYTLQTGDTPILWTSGTSINVNDIVEYSSNYYKAKYAFTCGSTFTKVAFEQYVPKSLTEAQIEEIIRDFNPAFDGALGFVVQDSAPAHNAVFRSNDLTDYFNSGQMSEAIADGSFRNIFPGDYIIKSLTVNGTTYNDIKWIVGDLNYFLHNGDTECTTNHVLVFPEVCIGTSYMNSSNTTSGGYVGSYMWTTRIPQYVTGIQNAFGSSHVLSHRELLTTAISTGARSSAMYDWSGASNNWAWKDVLVNIFNENMIYGGAQCSSSMFDTGDGNTQISVMRHHKSYIHTRSNWYWLRSVGSSATFAVCAGNGGASLNGASLSGGLRPYFLLL
jgi:hypothetical protein